MGYSKFRPLLRGQKSNLQGNYMTNITAAPTAPDTPITAAPAFITEAVFSAIMDEHSRRIAKVEAINAILIDAVDALAAEVAELKTA
jgi:hypothetical protein